MAMMDLKLKNSNLIIDNDKAFIEAQSKKLQKLKKVFEDGNIED